MTTPVVADDVLCLTVLGPADALYMTDVLNQVATFLEWRFVQISRSAAVCRSWREAFAPRLASLPARLRESVSELFNDELLRRPVMWDMRIAAALEGMENLTLQNPLHKHVCTSIERLRFCHSGAPRPAELAHTTLSDLVGQL